MLNMRHVMRGFTLIELMVGLIVIAILVSAGAPNLMIWIQNTQLRTAAETLSAGAQLAKAEAVRRNTNVFFRLNDGTATANVNSSWTVGCVTPVADLDGDGLADCPASIQTRSGTEGTSKAVVNADVATVSFNGLGRAANPMTVSITNPTGGTCQNVGGPMRCLDIRVSQGGQILMCNPAFQRNTNPQGC